MAKADDLAANLRLLRPIRVLVLSRDRRFVGLARLLLARDDLLVDAASRLGDAMERARDGTDVVVVDDSNGPAPAAQVVAEIEATCPDVGVVVVAEKRGRANGTLRPLPKWGSPDELGREIRHAYLRRHRRHRLVP